jgi:hypothetical protein
MSPDMLAIITSQRPRLRNEVGTVLCPPPALLYTQCEAAMVAAVDATRTNSLSFFYPFNRSRARFDWLLCNFLGLWNVQCPVLHFFKYLRLGLFELLGRFEMVRIDPHVCRYLVAGLGCARNMRNSFLTFFRSSALACLRFGGGVGP